MEVKNTLESMLFALNGKLPALKTRASFINIVMISPGETAAWQKDGNAGLEKAGRHRNIEATPTRIYGIFVREELKNSCGSLKRRTKTKPRLAVPSCHGRR